MQDGYRSVSWKIPDNTKAFRLIDLKVPVIREVELHIGAA
jgi:hypothetical protein